MTIQDNKPAPECPATLSASGKSDDIDRHDCAFLVMSYFNTYLTAMDEILNSRAYLMAQQATAISASSAHVALYSIIAIARFLLLMSFSIMACAPKIPG